MKTIKRYPNRKLYDTEFSRYITLEEIAQHLKEGGEVTVVDSRTGQDITSVTLAQVLLGEEKKSRADVSLQRLIGMIQTGGEFIQKKIGSNVTNLKDEAEKTVQKLMKGEPAEELREFIFATHSAYDDLQKKMDDRLRVMLAAVRNISPLQNEIDDLRRALDALERRVASIEGGKAGAAKRKASGGRRTKK